MLIAADFDQAYSTKACNYEQPPCEPPACFVGSYAPVAKVGDPNGKFFINSSLDPIIISFFSELISIT